MRSTLFSALALCLVALASGCGTPTTIDASGLADASADAALTDGPLADQAALPRKLTLLYTNDEHSHLFAFAPESDDFPIAPGLGTGALKGGVARRVTVLQRERAAAAKAGAATLTLSAGDNVMGTLSEVGFTVGAPDFALMKVMGYDATCLGNHEFDFGPAALAVALKLAQSSGGLVPTVSTNIHFDPVDPRDDTLAAAYSATPDPTRLVEKYHVLTTSNGLRVGIVGIVGVNAAYVETPKAPVRFSLGVSMKENDAASVLPAIYADLQPTVDRLRTVEKVDLVIALSHSGVDLQTPENGEDYQIAANVPGLDVIISGHTHTVVPAPIVVQNPITKKQVPVVQAGAFGVYVGRLDLTIAVDGGVSFDPTTSKLLPVDDTLAADPGGVAMAVSQSVRDLENKPFGATGKSFLEGALSRIVGTPVKHDPMTDGDLYFRPLGQAAFDVTGDPTRLPSRETAIVDLSADALLAAADRYASPKGGADFTDVAVQATGVIRGELPKGKTGALAFADLFRILPLGASTVDGSIGYPMTHFYIFFAELKAAFEVAAYYGLTAGSSDLFLVPSGMRVTFDTARAPFDSKKDPMDPQNGRIIKIEWISDHSNGFEGPFDLVLFDITRNSPWKEPGSGRNALTLYGVATNYYIASFADSVGVTLKNANGKYLPLPQTIVHRGDVEKSEVKDFEAFAEYIHVQSLANHGNLPSRYDSAAMEGKLPRRMICLGAACPR